MKITEHAEQVNLIKWFRYQYPKFAKCLWAIPNGGARHIHTAIKLKAEGVVAGVPDLFLMIPKNDWHGMFIEMKTKDGKLQENQKEFIGLATLMGYQSHVCYGFEDAKNAVIAYLKD